MKKIFLILLLVWAGITYAEVPTMEVNSASTVRDYAIADIRKITFDSSTDAMIINLHSSEQISYAIADISTITFRNVNAPSAIEDVEVFMDGKQVQKIIRDGQLLIIKDGVAYNLMGERVMVLGK